MLYSNHEMEQRDSLFFRSTQRREINKNDFVRTMTPQILVLLLATVATVYSACDNHCSGHGTCNTDDVCTCYDNWGIGQAHDSGDCSERVCPYELAWVDDPNKNGKFHKYAECSGRGLCDRATGECQCFDGYEGKGCARTTCPNDCSGHGTCEYIDDMSFGATWTDYSVQGFHTDSKTFEFSSWDAGKTRGCVCDATYGDIDCSKRMCPYGNDILDVRDDLSTAIKYQVQDLIFVANENRTAYAATPADNVRPLHGETFALTFTSKLNETFTTIPIVFDTEDLDDMKVDIQLALLSLPNKVIDGVSVSVTKGSTDMIRDDDANVADLVVIDMVKVSVTFTGPSVQGPQHFLQVHDYECSSGCTPKITGLSLNYKYDYYNSNITETTLADWNSCASAAVVASDYETGLCQCFASYFGDNCNTLYHLV